MGRSKILCPRVSDVLLAYDVFPVIFAELAAFRSFFSKETVCEKFQIAHEKVVVTVSTT